MVAASSTATTAASTVFSVQASFLLLLLAAGLLSAHASDSQCPNAIVTTANPCNHTCCAPGTCSSASGDSFTATGIVYECSCPASSHILSQDKGVCHEIETCPVAGHQLVDGYRCETCPVGYVDSDFDPNTSCVRCPVGSFQALPGQTACNVVTPCRADHEFMAQEHTTSTDRVCATISQCTPSYSFQVASPSPTTDRVCKSRKVLVLVEVWLNVTFETHLSTPRERAYLKRNITSHSPDLPEPVAIDLNSTNYVEPNSTLCSLWVLSHTEEAAVKRYIQANQLTVTLGDTTTLTARLFTETQALAFAQVVFWLAVRDGMTIALATDRAIRGYQMNGGMSTKNNSVLSVLPTVDDNRPLSALEQVNNMPVLAAVAGAGVVVIVSVALGVAVVVRLRKRTQLRKQLQTDFETTELGKHEVITATINPTFNDDAPHGDFEEPPVVLRRPTKGSTRSRHVSFAADNDVLEPSCSQFHPKKGSLSPSLSQTGANLATYLVGAQPNQRTDTHSHMHMMHTSCSKGTIAITKSNGFSQKIKLLRAAPPSTSNRRCT
eukprot:m.58844 g.58844  ORF g.58844 m.58844 type:complete len:550 (+) comp11728_c0_seq3:682-2331(+)